MALRGRFLSVMDTALRVPPLFVIDEVLKLSFGFTKSMHLGYSSSMEAGTAEVYSGTNLLPPQNVTEESDVMLHVSEDLMLTFIPAVAKITMFICAYLIAVVVFLLSYHRLVRVYLMVGSVTLVVAGYQANMATTKFVTLPVAQGTNHSSLLETVLALDWNTLWNSSGMLATLGANYIFQGILGCLCNAMHGTETNPVMQKIVLMSFLMPTCALFLPLPAAILTNVPVCAALVPLGYVKFTVATNFICSLRVVVDGLAYARQTIRDFGLHSLLESEWSRLNVPSVLRTFWLLRVAHHVANLLGEYMMTNGDYYMLFEMEPGTVYSMFRAVMIQGCETVIALLGMSSLVAFVAHHIGVFFQSLLLLSDDDEERSLGTVCAVLFFVLAEQSGLTILEGDKRFLRLCRNFCLLFTAMLHFVHNMVNPMLMSLSASRNPIFQRHARALIVCMFLLVCPIMLMYGLWSTYGVSTWLLAVSAFSVQVIIKTIVSLLIYGLFLIDAYSFSFWERLDDHVYYIRAFGNTVEFIFGILLFFNGAWIYFFESGGSIRAFMMCVHAYFNIWCEARHGWSVFIKRRMAVNKINSLPEASIEQLRSHDDVCAICFQELLSARITQCHHFFHSVCLRKWLYVQDSCPLCHETLYKPETGHKDNMPHTEDPMEHAHDDEDVERMDLNEGGDVRREATEREDRIQFPENRDSNNANPGKEHADEVTNSQPSEVSNEENDAHIVQEVTTVHARVDMLKDATIGRVES